MIPVVFFGTHEFAATILKALLLSGFFDIKLVITQPDRPAGRHQEFQKTAVKIVAEQNNLKIEQPASLKNFSRRFSDPDATSGESTGRDTDSASGQLNIVVDYGIIIPQEIIEAPKFGSINIHPSLLPKYRGASPIQSALINGEKKTGVTIMKMDEEMDHGPILAQEKVAIGPEDDYPSLYKKLAVKAAEMIVKIIPLYVEGKIKVKEQDHPAATFTKILSREDGKIDFKNKTADEICNLWRGLTPWPGIFCQWNGKRMKLLEITISEKNLQPGKILAENKRIFVGCKTGSLEIKKFQLEGKKPMEAGPFLVGYGNFHGSQLG